ncbi:MAG: LemA family protein [Chlamydiales bacterium]|jgi:LemA protein|nr:LemA family protein [Chlamydiales bacterium]
MNKNRYGLWGFFLFVGIAIIWSIGSYNSLLVYKQDVDHQWSQVETQYQRRLDLIPNLVAATKGYMKHEQGVLENLANARKGYANARNTADQINTISEMDGALSRLLMVVENYPDLKANQTIHALTDEIAGTENRIAVERKRFNDTVRRYNLRVQTFPSKIVASIFNFEQYPYLKAQVEAAQAPKISFD